MSEENGSMVIKRVGRVGLIGYSRIWEGDQRRFLEVDTGGPVTGYNEVLTLRIFWR